MEASYKWRILCGLLMLFMSSVRSFLMRPTTDSCLATSSTSARPGFFLSASSINPNDLETPEEREERMKLVRQIQKSYYVGAEEGLVQTSENNPTFLEEVPLWRVQWTEFPGYQNVLNVHVAHYTHMFRRILSGPKPWLFGHIYLPGGSENLDNPQYRFNAGTQATFVGTLLQVTDYQQLDDGRLALIVQGLERFRVVKATQHVPYAIATIQLDSDLEISSSFAKADDVEEARNTEALAVQENLEWRNWEFRPTYWDEMSDGIGVSPLVNYNSDYFPNEMMVPAASTSDLPKGSHSVESVERDKQKITRLEYDVWVALDTMIRLLAQLQPDLRIPVPAQLLGLLPVDVPGNNKWPKDFRLEEYANQLQSNNAEIGTTTKSPFVRIAENSSYPLLRRASRLSYVIWVILDSIVLEGAPTKQDLLEETSIAKRLEKAQMRLKTVNMLLLG
jgi:Lon protease-like protein